MEREKSLSIAEYVHAIVRLAVSRYVLTGREPEVTQTGAMPVDELAERLEGYVKAGWWVLWRARTRQPLVRGVLRSCTPP